MCLCFWLKEKTVFPLQLVHYNPTMWAKCSEGPVKPQYLHQITTAGTLLWAQEQAGLFVSAVPVPHPMCSKLTPPKHSKSPKMAPLYFPMQKQIFWCPVKKRKTKEKKSLLYFSADSPSLLSKRLQVYLLKGSSGGCEPLQDTVCPLSYLGHCWGQAHVLVKPPRQQIQFSTVHNSATTGNGFL